MTKQEKIDKLIEQFKTEYGYDVDINNGTIVNIWLNTNNYGIEELEDLLERLHEIQNVVSNDNWEN